MHIFDLWTRPGVVEAMVPPRPGYLQYQSSPGTLYGYTMTNASVHVFDLWTRPGYLPYPSAPNTLYAPIMNFHHWWRLSRIEKHHANVSRIRSLS